MATAIPTWTDTYNQWFTGEYLPWINSVQSTNVQASDLTVSPSGAITPNAAIPLWNWNTGADTAQQKAILDQRYLESVNAYNAATGSNIKPDTSVLGANVQPNTTYRAADEGSWYSPITNVLGDAVDLINSGIESVGDFATNHPVEAALLVAGGYYFAPEIGAWISPAGEAVAGTEAGVAASEVGASEALSGVDLGGVGGSPNTWMGAGEYGVVPEAIAGTGTIAGGIGGETAAAAAGGLTAANVIKALPLVPIVNQLAGDPLGLNQTQAPTTTGKTGFNIVPIPSEWKSPSASVGTYSPIDLNSIFSNQNLLAGTQWQGLPNQRNLTFNDIFASGQQSTPMGSPVNVNNLVSAILGQTSTSQKST